MKRPFYPLAATTAAAQGKPMIRFILRRKIGLVCGLRTENLYTLDYEQPELESALKGGGYGEDLYDYTELVGVEIIESPPPNSPSDSSSEVRTGESE